jgi:hypothetical protein
MQERRAAPLEPQPEHERQHGQSGVEGMVAPEEGQQAYEAAGEGVAPERRCLHELQADPDRHHRQGGLE